MSQEIKLQTQMRMLEIDGSSGDEHLETLFAELLSEVFELWKRKEHDYGPHNVSRFWVRGIVVRMWDKMARLVRLVWDGDVAAVKDESVIDTLIDIGVYGLMGVMMLRNQWPVWPGSDDA